MDLDDIDWGNCHGYQCHRSAQRKCIACGLNIGNPPFDAQSGDIRAAGSSVAHGTFLAAFGELQMRTETAERLAALEALLLDDTRVVLE